MPGQFSITSRSDGNILTASIYNADRQDIVDHLEPQYIDDASVNLAAMQTVTDPGELTTESLATTMAGEIERLRYAIQEIKVAMNSNLARWYQTPYGTGWYNVKSYGAVGNGSTDDRTAINSALNAGIVYFPAGTYLIGSNLTIAATITLFFDPGAMLSIANGVTVTHNGGINPTDHQIFSFTGTGTITITNIDRVNALWFGVKRDATFATYGVGTNNSTASQKAIDAVKAKGGTVFFPKGVYDFASGLTLYERMGFTGEAAAEQSMDNVTYYGTILQYGGNSNFFAGSTLNHLYIGNLCLLGRGSAGQTGVYLGGAFCRLDNLRIQDFDGAGSYGLRLNGTAAGTGEVDYCRFTNIDITGNQTGLLIEGHPTNGNTFNGLTVRANVADGVRITGCVGLQVFGYVIEGNGTGGTGTNLKIAAGSGAAPVEDIYFIGGRLELTTETGTRKNLELPAADVETRNITIWGFSSHAPVSNFTTEKTHSYFLSNPDASVNDPIRITNLMVNRLSSYYPTSAAVKPLIEVSNSNYIIGPQAIDAPIISARTKGSIANDGIVNLSGDLGYSSASVKGILFVSIDTPDNASAIYMLNNNATIEVSDPANLFSVTAGNAGTANIYWDAGDARYELENKRGGTRTFSFHLFGMP